MPTLTLIRNSAFVLLQFFSVLIFPVSVVCQEIRPEFPRFENIRYPTGEKIRQFLLRHDQMAVEFESIDVANSFPQALEIEEPNVTLELDEDSSRFGAVRIYKIRGEPVSLLAQQMIASDVSKRDGVVDAGAVLLQSRNGRPYLLKNELSVRVDDVNLDDKMEFDAFKSQLPDSVKFRKRYGRDDRTLLLELTSPLDVTVVDVAKSIRKLPDVKYVALVYAVFPSVSKPVTGPIKAWHHINDGMPSGTDDADIDTNRAWSFSRGDKVIAVIENGFFIDHDELIGNRWENLGEIPNNNCDDEGNGKPDDVHGWNFDLGKPDFSYKTHGVRVSGLIAARGANPHGVTGSAPEGRIMFLQAKTGAEFAEAIEYAKDEGADVISISFAPMDDQDFHDAVVDASEKGRCTKGCVILFSLPWCDCYSNDCSGATIPECCCLKPDSLCSELKPYASFVSFSNRFDKRFQPCGLSDAFGDCMSFMAPGHQIATIDSDGSGSNLYTGGFVGTSAATPIAAGVASLVLSVAPDLESSEVKKVLQDTCDKTEPIVGEYNSRNGFSTPTSTSSTHGFGRLNAYEAVKLMATDSAKGGRGGIDLMVRDNDLDWGNTEQPSSVRFRSTRDTISFMDSPDIKVDVGPYWQNFDGSADGFVKLNDEYPQPGADARVYVRVRNRGPIKAEDVSIRLYATDQSMLPTFPLSFWNGQPLPAGQTSNWDWVSDTTLTLPDVCYSGPSDVRNGVDNAEIVQFSWKIPSSFSNNYTLLTTVESDKDPLPTHEADLSLAVPYCNNLALRSYAPQPFFVKCDTPQMSNGAGTYTIKLPQPFSNPPPSQNMIGNCAVSKAPNFAACGQTACSESNSTQRRCICEPNLIRPQAFYRNRRRTLFRGLRN